MKQLNPLNQEAVDKLLALSEMLSGSMSLEDMEKDLWEWLLAGIAPTNEQYDTPAKRGDLVFFYEQVKEAMQTIYHLTEQEV